MIISEYVKIKIGTKNIKHFSDLNYKCKVGEYIEVKPNELMKSSKTKIKVKCDICNKIKTIRYEAYIKNISKYPLYCCNNWLDGYDIENNVAYEYDEKSHFVNGQLKEKDRIRQLEIENFLRCKFIRIKSII